MAKVVITVDTETKEMSVMLNGAEVSDVNYVGVEKYRPEYPEMKMVTITTSKEDESEEVYTYTHISASIDKDITKYLQEKGLV
jgi:hypothetical protein